ncbi:MAG: family 10 glycosylhydrolase [Bacteroidales bacterium]|jgi:uncharacterized lipoprotein YddW (UPF0748 family)|nr:family 10 glycosylhydrolase [Bacteroidales bacterium]
MAISIRHILRFLSIISFLLIFSVNAEASYDGKREWRAVWIATVNNIDWPSSPDLSADQQKKELIQMLDLYKSMNFNAVVLQVRPAADAFYKPGLEPWSIYLTGDQKKAPVPFYDPLAFAIKEAHKRGMELHAWLNPYRVSQNVDNIKDMSPDHIYRKKPYLFVKHGRRLYFDPAYPETREFLTSVIKDLVSRYDLDGIHFDDYFYPNNDFSDESSFAKHNRGYKREDKMAWRRENVDIVVKMLRDTIKSVKPFVKFGISPYAVWRNKAEDSRGSETRSFGYTNYDHLHADILKWMEAGWLDYILPQLYFNIGYPAADFKILAQWWRDYSAGTPVYGGLGTYKLDKNSKVEAWRSAEEIRKQAEMLRQIPEYHGVCYFSAKDMKRNTLGINSVLTELYPSPSITPSLRGFETTPPLPPLQTATVLKQGKMHLVWSGDPLPEGDAPLSAINSDRAYYYLVYKFKKGAAPDFNKGEAIVALTGETSLVVDINGEYDYYVSALDRLYNESIAVKFKGLK